MPHRTPQRRHARPKHRASRRLGTTMASVAAAYAATALAIALVVSVVMPVAANQRKVSAMSVMSLPTAATPAAAAALADRDVERRPSRTMPRTTIKQRPARVASQVTIKRITWALPVSGYHLTSRFGDQSYLWSSGMHTGLDFAAPSGTPIRSIADGVVREAGYAGSYGYRTIVTLPGGGEVWYCHQTSVSVSPGQSVRAGQTIGTVGATGNVTGSHLHLEMRPNGEHGDPVDPYAVLVGQGITP